MEKLLHDAAIKSAAADSRLPLLGAKGLGQAVAMGRGAHSSASQLNLSRF